jgi:hypothetical protein
MLLQKNKFFFLHFLTLNILFIKTNHIGILTRTWGGSARGGDIVLVLTPSFFFLNVYFKLLPIFLF